MIYLFHGEDNFRREQAVSQLETDLVDPDWRSTNFVQLTNPSISDFSDTVAACPFGMGERLVIIKEAKFLTNKSDDQDIQAILAALGELPERVSVVLNSTKILGTLKLVKEIKKIAEVEEFKAFQPWDTKPVAAWLSKIAKAKKISIDNNAIEFLVDYIGTDTSKLYSELERLDLLLAKKDSSSNKKISPELIQRECKAKHDIFRFAEELAKGNKEVSRNELKKIIDNDDVNIGFLAGLQTNLSRYLKLKLLQRERISQDEQAKQLSVSSGRLFYLKKSVDQMQVDHLLYLNDELSKIELQVKQGKSSLDFALRVLVSA